MGAKKAERLPKILQNLEEECPAETLHSEIFGTEWKDRGICLHVDNSDPLFFTSSGGAISAITCTVCPVKYQCLIWGLIYNEEGTWGGTNDAERKSYIEQKRDHVVSIARRAKSLGKYFPALDPFGRLIHESLLDENEGDEPIEVELDSAS